MRTNPEIDGHKFHLHPDKVAQWLKTGDCYPIHIEVGLINRCNHDCVFCGYDWFSSDGSEIPKEVMSRNLEGMGRHGVKSVMYGGTGEPLLSRNIGFLTRKTKESGIDVAITTNGVLFRESRREECLPYLSWIKFSIDAGTPETYAQIHRTRAEDFSILLDNIKKSVELKRRKGFDVTIGTQCLVLPQNRHEIELLTRQVRDIGVDYLSVKPYCHHPYSDPKHETLFMDTSSEQEFGERLKELQTEEFKVFFRSGMSERLNTGNNYPQCYALPFISIIASNGDVLPCDLYYGNPEFSFGNINEQSFSQIWEGSRRKEILEKIRSRGVEGCRPACRCDAGNRYLDRLKNPQDHDNFT